MENMFGITISALKIEIEKLFVNLKDKKTI